MEVANWGRGIFANWNSSIGGGDNLVNNCEYGVYSGTLSNIYIYNTTLSNNTTYGAYAYTGSELLLTGMTYSGNTNNTGVGHNGRITSF